MRCLFRVILCSAAFVLTATAERSLKDWQEELSAAYLKQESLIVTYTSQGKKNSLEATMALEHSSGLRLLRVLGKIDGKIEEVRNWNTPDDHFYVQTSLGLIRVDGVEKEARYLTEILVAVQKLREEPGPPIVSSSKISLLFDKESIAAFAGLSIHRESPWKYALAKAKVDEFNEETVTFTTPDHGKLTFNRSNGLLILQSVKGKQGDDRTLIAENVRLNPGKEAILQLSSEWDTEAEAKPSFNVTRTFRAEIFQDIVDWVDQGHLAQEKLDTWLEEPHGLDRFISVCLRNGPDTLSADDYWKEWLDYQKNKLKTAWVETYTGPKADEDKAFEAHLKDPKIRNASCKELMPDLLKDKDVRDWVMVEIFVDQPRPQGKTDNGKATAEKIQDLLIRAYISDIADRKMTEFWGKAAGTP